MNTILYDQESNYTLQLLNMLGRGSQGQVYKAKDIQNNIYAVKKVSNEQTNEIRISWMLTKIQKSRKFKHIIGFHRVLNLDQDNQNTYIQLEYCDGPNLYELLRKNLSEFERLDYIYQLIEAVEEVHSLDIVHRDLKPENVVSIRDGEKTILKLCDFGIAKHVEQDKFSRTTYIGTPTYMIPLKDGTVTIEKENDIWSLGAIIFEVYTGERLINGQTSEEITNQTLWFQDLNVAQINQFLHQRIEPYGLLGSKGLRYTFPQQIKMLLLGMLDPDKQQRYKLAQIKETLDSIIFLIERSKTIERRLQNSPIRFSQAQKVKEMKPKNRTFVPGQNQPVIKIINEEVVEPQYDRIFNNNGLELIKRVGISEAIHQIESEVERLVQA